METFNYCSTWGASQRLIPKELLSSKDLVNNSLKQIFKISLGGNKFRIKLSNYYGNENLEIKGLSIAKYISGSENKIDIKTNKKITFNNNNEEIIIKKGEEIYTDIFDINLEPSTEIAISIFFGNVPNDITGHKHSLTNSYIEKGNKIYEEKFSNEYILTNWCFISNIEVVSEKENKCVVCFGDSITDGRFSSLNKQERWPDFLFDKIIKTKNEKIYLGINNQSLSGSFLTKEGIQRFEKDVLNQNGIKYIIILYGINDITKLNKEENEIIENYQKLINKAHELNIKIYGGTLLPFKGYRLYSEKKNDIRNKINDWIRNCKNGFDDFIDFDLIIRDEKDTEKIKDIYNSGDGVHLNSNGYKKMVEAFNDLTIFEK